MVDDRARLGQLSGAAIIAIPLDLEVAGRPPARMGKRVALLADQGQQADLIGKNVGRRRRRIARQG
jgi:hypothetical protein